MGYPMICIDARRAADAIKSRRIKSDKADAVALAEMPRTGWFWPVHVKSLDSHRLKTLLGARDQLVKAKRSRGNQVRGLLRPFGISLPSRVGAKKFAEAAYQATQANSLMHASLAALLEALASIDAQVANPRTWIRGRRGPQGAGAPQRGRLAVDERAWRWPGHPRSLSSRRSRTGAASSVGAPSAPISA
jgi:Transposase and inactivated derivatives